MNKTLRNFALVALAAAPFSVSAEILGSGTAADPYQIATPEDLVAANTKVAKGDVTYFVQTADIDMTGVENYQAINGTWGDYTSAIVYDGANHVIKNFAPKYAKDGEGNGYYCTSIFGVMTGKVKNLGVVDANVNTTENAGQGAGILAAYFGYPSGAGLDFETSTFENVYVTGTLKAGSKYTGAFAGTTNSPVELINCFANVNVEVAGGPAGALIGRTNNPVTLTCCYVAGTVSEACSLVSGSGSGSVETDGVVVFNTGSSSVCATTADAEVTMANTSALKSAGIDEVKSWDAFSETEEVDGFPALNYVLSGEGTKDNPYIIASAQDLANAYRFVDGINGGDFYFVQTADIDMEGVEDYSCLAGYNGAYKAVLYYDGQNHLIKNFAPNDTPIGNAEATRYYYCTSIFGVPQGEIKNLGVVGAYVGTVQGAGILGAYAGHEMSGLTVQNVFVEGVVSGAGGYTGGMFGTSGGKGTDITIVNSFANVEVEGKAFTAGLVGRLQDNLGIEAVYVAGTVAGDAPFLVCDAKGKPNVEGMQVVAFNTGATAAFGSAANTENLDELSIATENDKDALISEVTEWNGYTSNLYKGYPMLADFDVETSGIFDAVIDNVEANGPAVYYNLQGVRVANPENGIYIVRRGNKATKVLVK